MPTDFVFVDLSPVKSDEEKSSPASPLESPYVEANDSMSLASDCDSVFSQMADPIADDVSLDAYVQDASFFGALSAPAMEPMGLGIMNVDYPQSSVVPSMPQFPNWMAQQMAFQQFLQFQQSMMKQPPASPEQPHHKRAKSTSSVPTKKQKPAFQFKTYTGPKQKAHRRSESVPVTKPATPASPAKSADLEDFMDLNNQIELFLESDLQGSYTPISDYSDEDLEKPINYLEGIDLRDDFDLNAFILI